MPRRQRQFGFFVAAIGLALIARLTLVPHPEAVARAAATPLACIFCGNAGGVDFFLNLLLFVPLGVGLVLAGFSWRRAVVLAGLTTFGVELLQMKIVAGRDASLGDIVANTFGCGLGAIVTVKWRQIAFPDPPHARRLGLGYAVFLGWVWAGTAWALGPNLPQGGAWFGQWAPDLSNYGRFLGTPLSVAAGGEPLPPGPALNQARLEDIVTARPMISFTAVLGEPARRLAIVGGIVDGREGDLIFLAQERQDLAYRVRMRTSILKVWTPTVNLKDGMAGLPGDTVEAEGGLRDGAFELRSRIGGKERTRRLELSPSWGWSLVTPWASVLGEEASSLTAFWVAGVMAPLAYWAVLAGGASLLIPPATVLLLLGAIPKAAGFQPVHWGEWVAALAGILVGLLASRSAVRNRAHAADREDNAELSVRTPVIS